MTGNVVETTLEMDKIAMPVLTLIPDEKIGIKQLAYGELLEQFRASKCHIINPQTLEIEFVVTTTS